MYAAVFAGYLSGNNYRHIAVSFDCKYHDAVHTFFYQPFRSLCCKERLGSYSQMKLYANKECFITPTIQNIMHNATIIYHIFFIKLAIFIISMLSPYSSINIYHNIIIRGTLCGCIAVCLSFVRWQITNLLPRSILCFLHSPVKDKFCKCATM